MKASAYFLHLILGNFDRERDQDNWQFGEDAEDVLHVPEHSLRRADHS